jgi:ATP-dependent DNA helicase RecQ
MKAALKALKSSYSLTTGQLYKQLFPREQMPRNDFDALLNALASAGLVSIEEAVFEKEGRSIAFRKVTVTSDGEDVDERVLAELPLKDKAGAPNKKSQPKAASSKSTKKTKDEEPEAELAGRAAELWEKLRAWRQAEAKDLGTAAFMVLGNKTLRAIAIEEPHTIDELLNVSGIGPSKAEKFGEAICKLCSES